MEAFIPRLDFGRRLEPVGDRVLHGAGQSYDAFRSYFDALANHKPALYMTYVSLRDDLPAYFQALQRELASFEPYALIPQIGLYMNGGGLDEHPVPPYDGAVAAGEYDEQISQLCDGLKSLGRPAFLRIGFEFNGGWNGYEPAQYRQVWIRIVQALRHAGLEQVATVWCYCPLPSSREAAGRIDRDYWPYYPGDEWVDWWSIDLFSVPDFSIDNARWFMADAVERGFPVMIGEATPRGIAVQGGMETWHAWYAPFFDFIRTQPAVKAFCYINWNWSTYEQFADWGDARVEANPQVLTHYKTELASPWYQHADAG